MQKPQCVIVPFQNVLFTRTLAGTYDYQATIKRITGKRAHVIYTWSSQNCNVPVGH